MVAGVCCNRLYASHADNGGGGVKGFVFKAFSLNQKSALK